MVVSSGLVGALGAILGKVALSHTTPLSEYLRYYCEIYFSMIFDTAYCWNFVYGLRLSSFIIMFYCNALALSLFLKALERRSSLIVTIVVSAVNFLVTGILSSIVLGEKISSRWFLGSLVICFGVCLVGFSQGGMKRTE